MDNCRFDLGLIGTVQHVTLLGRWLALPVLTHPERHIGRLRNRIQRYEAASAVRAGARRHIRLPESRAADPAGRGRGRRTCLLYSGKCCLTSGVTTQLESLSLPSCSCRELVGMIHRYYSNGEILRNAQFDLVSLNVQEIRGITAAVDVEYLDHAAQVIGQGNRVLAGRAGAGDAQPVVMVRAVERQCLLANPSI